MEASRSASPESFRSWSLDGGVWESPYSSARFVAFLLLACLLVSSFLTVRTLVGEAAARIAVLPTLALLGLAQFPFLELTTEMLPIALLAVSTYLFSRMATGRVGRLDAYLAGFFLGMVPFAKIQAAPLSVLLFGLGFFGVKSLARNEGALARSEEPPPLRSAPVA